MTKNGRIRICGIDYSLTSPALCVFIGNSPSEFNYKNCQFYFLTQSEKYAKQFPPNILGSIPKRYASNGQPEMVGHPCQRYENISNWVLNILNVFTIDKVYLEDYSYGSKGRVFHIAENAGILKYKLWVSGRTVMDVPPTVVKKFATERGNATKEMMYEQFSQDTNMDLMKLVTPDKTVLSNPVTDIVDSYYICKYGIQA